MKEIKNERFYIKEENGAITKFYDLKDNNNLAGNKMLLGTTAFTLDGDDIKTDKFSYKERVSKGEEIPSHKDVIELYDKENDIRTKISFEKGIKIENHSKNPSISEFGINLGFKFLGEENTDFSDDILPASPYITDDKNFTYCIMNKIGGGYIVAVSKTKCDGWKIDYSNNSYGHNMENFKFLSSFDKLYKGSGRKENVVYIDVKKSISDCYKYINSIYEVPVFRCLLSGNFLGSPVVEVSKDTKELTVISPLDNKINIEVKEKRIIKIPVKEYGFYKVIPVGEKEGVSGYLYYGKDMKSLFYKNMKALKMPYHVDYNLCEGGCFLWAMLINKYENKNNDFDDIIKEELSVIMDESSKKIPRRTIVPYEKDGHPPYHISGSDRIQEQFFGVSILTMAYLVFNDCKYLTYAINSMNTLIDNYIEKDGMIKRKDSDYTTVCAPLIAIVDLANIVKDKDKKEYKKLYNASVSVADYLVKRGFSFPTEGKIDTKSDAEDGSISCTALSVLYVCKNLCFKEEYIDFAKKILNLHNGWRIEAPDSKMNGSSLRWWETIWEGDADGPGICAGHAWTLWRGEALFLLGIMTFDDNILIDSWNAFVTNFSKINEKGESYSCYVPDFLTGGGVMEEKESLLTFVGKNKDKKYNLVHSYPKIKDNSLSKYLWVRNRYTWENLSALFNRDDVLFTVNAEMKDDIVVCNNDKLYIGENIDKVKVKTDRDIEIICKKKYKIKKNDDITEIIIE